MTRAMNLQKSLKENSQMLSPIISVYCKTQALKQEEMLSPTVVKYSKRNCHQSSASASPTVA